MSVEAVMFFGYDLGSVDDAFGWEGETIEDEEPEWIQDGTDLYDEDYAVAMTRTVLKAAEVDFSKARPGWLQVTDLNNLLERNCGVQFLPYGHNNTQFYGIALAGTVYTADDWSPKRVSPVLPDHGPGGSEQDILDNSAKLLRDALKALNLKPSVEGPSWIISTRE